MCVSGTSALAPLCCVKTVLSLTVNAASGSKMLRQCESESVSERERARERLRQTVGREGGGVFVVVGGRRWHGGVQGGLFSSCSIYRRGNSLIRDA